MNLRMTIFLLLTNFCYTLYGQDINLYNSRILKNDKKYYTVQIASFPVSQKEKLFEMLNQFRDDNNISYYTEYRDPSTRQKYLRLRLGFFTDLTSAIKYGNQISDKIKSEIFIDKQNLIIESRKEITVIQTPSTIWLYHDNKYRNIFDI